METHITNQAAKALDSDTFNAKFEVVKEVPDWIRIELEKKTGDNWKLIS